MGDPQKESEARVIEALARRQRFEQMERLAKGNRDMQKELLRQRMEDGAKEHAEAMYRAIRENHGD